MAYDLDSPVSVPAPQLATYRAALTAAAGTIGEAVLADAFTKLANAALPVDNRFLVATWNVYDWSQRRGNGSYDTLHAAALDVLNTAVGIP